MSSVFQGLSAKKSAAIDVLHERGIAVVGGPVDTILRDVRYALRTLLQARSFTIIAVLTLALGIGANTAMFSVVNSVLLRPLPFPQPDRLMYLATLNSRHGTPVPSSLSYPDFIDYRSQNQSFEELASYYGNNYSLTGVGEAALLRGEVVSASLFKILQVPPKIGRGFSRDDDQPGHHVAVISHALWVSRFHSDPNITQRSLSLSGKPYSIVGVAPEGFQFPIQSDATDIWLTSSRDAEVDDTNDKPANSQRGAHFIEAIGRLKPGVAREQAEAELSAIAERLSVAYPDTNTNEKAVAVRELLSQLTGDTRRPLLILLAAVGCVLLIACANVANLVLARSSGRSREIALRAALGASRPRIIRQLITESLVLAVVGAIAGTFIAKWAISGVVGLYPHNLPRAEQVGIDPRVLAFTAALAIVTGILFGLAPAVQASRTNLNEAMREGGRGASGSSRHSRLRSGLVVAETAVGVMLLIGAGLLIRSMNRLTHVDLGFDPEHVLTANFDLSQTRYNADQQDRFYTELLTKLRALPGVSGAAGTGQMPLANDDWSISFNILERPLPKSQQPSAAFYDVTPGFFETLKVPLVQGRTFDEHDTRASKPVMIVNQEFARRYFPNEDPVGKMVEIGAGDGAARAKWKTREIVGVVGNIRSSQIGSVPRPAYFVPLPQLIWGPPTLIVRATGDPTALISAVRKTLATMDADAPIYDLKTLSDYVALDLGRARFQTVLLSLFAGVALLLTTIGVYGVVAYGVAQRTHEIGVRMALGASRSDVLRMILNGGLMLTLAGVGVGVIGALALARLIESMLYEIPPRDPATYGIVCVTLSMVALLASYIPALRATRVDPMIALRYE
jgi:predicted permease